MSSSLLNQFLRDTCLVQLGHSVACRLWLDSIWAICNFINSASYQNSWGNGIHAPGLLCVKRHFHFSNQIWRALLVRMPSTYRTLQDYRMMSDMVINVMSTAYEQLLHMQPPKEPHSLQTEEDDGTWCLCKERKGGDMVGCDSKSCTIRWFHLECVELSAVPLGSVHYAMLTCTRIKQEKGRILNVCTCITSSVKYSIDVANVFCVHVVKRLFFQLNGTIPVHTLYNKHEQLSLVLFLVW